MPVADPIFQDDKALPYRVRIVDDFLYVNNVDRMDWPAMSPDLSCIEHVWDVLGRAVHVRLRGNCMLQDFRQFLREEQARVLQQTISKLLHLSKNRECRQTNGGYTHF